MFFRILPIFPTFWNWNNLLGVHDPWNSLVSFIIFLNFFFTYYIPGVEFSRFSFLKLISDLMGLIRSLKSFLGPDSIDFCYIPLTNSFREIKPIRGGGGFQAPLISRSDVDRDVIIKNGLSHLRLFAESNITSLLLHFRSRKVPLRPVLLSLHLDDLLRSRDAIELDVEWVS